MTSGTMSDCWNDFSQGLARCFSSHTVDGKESAVFRGEYDSLDAPLNVDSINYEDLDSQAH